MKALRAFTALIGAAFIGLGLLGTSSCGERVPPKIVQSSDGIFQLTVPGDWIIKEPGRKNSIIYTSDATGTLVVVVTRDPRAEGIGSVDELANGSRNGLMSDDSSSDATDIRQLVINGNQARQYEITRNGPQIRCLMTAVAPSGQYAMIAACTDLPIYGQNVPVLKGIVESFR